MATYYPLISGNPSDNTKLNLYAGDTDNLFDTYVFTDSTTGSQVAYLLFIVKNTHTSSDSVLEITEISGNADFNADFTINPPVSGSDASLLLGLSTNFAKAIGDISGTNTGYAVANTTDASSGSCTGADAFIGHNGSIEQDGTGFNVANSSFLLPIYKTSSIIGTGIPFNSYTSFLVKFAPSAVKTLAGEPKLTIKNNDNDIVLEFNGSVNNPLSFFAKVGTATALEGNDIFETTGATISDGGTFDLGTYPVNYDYGTLGKTLFFSDHSANAGNYQFRPADGFNSILRVGEIEAETVDGVAYTSSDFSTKPTGLFIQSWFATDTNLSFINDVGSQDPVRQNLNIKYKNSDVYKNFSLRSDSTFNQHPTHFKAVNATDDNVHLTNQHTTADDSKVTAVYKLGKIINDTNPDQTTAALNNEYFVFKVQVAFYSILTFNQAQTDLHAKAKNSNLKLETRCFNNYQASSGSTGPHFETRAGQSISTHALRGNISTLNIYARYNYFNTGSLATTDFTVPTFTVQSQTSLYSDFTGSNSDLNTKAKFLISGTTNDFTTAKAALPGTNITVSSSTTFSTFNQTSNNGNIIGLQYHPDVNRFMAEHMYNHPIANSTKYNVVTNENPFGFYTADFVPSEAGITEFWSKFAAAGGDEAAQPLYKMGFFPKLSHLRLLASDGGDLVTNSSGSNATPKAKLFTDASTSSAKPYSIATTKVSTTEWRAYNSTTAADTIQTVNDGNASVVANEGEWYGSGKAYITNPTCWGNSGSRQTANTNDNPYIGHFPTNTSRSSTTGEPTVHDFKEPGDNGGVNTPYYFRLPPASYNQSSAKWRSVGRFYFDNTGDYPIYIQAIEVKNKNFTNLEGGSIAYQSTKDAVMPKTMNAAGSAEVAVTYKPDNTNSPTPTFGIYQGKRTGDSPLSEAWDSSGKGYKYGASAVNFPANASSAVLGKTHYNDNNEYVSGSLYNGSKTNKRLLVEPQVDSGFFSREEDDSKVKSNKTENYIDVTFEVTPTNNAAYDNGVYYTQIAISYYVDEYENRKSVTADSDGYVETDLLLGATGNRTSRLYVSKYLIGVELTSAAEITLVDSEGDASPTAIELPNLSIG